MSDIVKNPLDDYQLLNNGSYFFANDDSYGVESTTTLVGTAKPYITTEDGEPGVVTGKPLNVVPRDDNDKGTYDNVSDVYYDPEHKYVEKGGETTTTDESDEG